MWAVLLVILSTLGPQFATGKPLTVYNAVQFGLVCDGAADNAAAIASMDATLTSGGGAVYFPPSATPCLTSAPITPPSNVALWGSPGTVIFKPTTNSAGNPLLFSASGVSNVSVKGLGFDGNIANVGDADNVVQVYNSSNVVFDQIVVQNTRGPGIVFSTSVTNSGVENSTLSNVGMYWQTSGQTSDQKQGIVFCCGSGNSGNFSLNNRFATIGLDAISLSAQSDFKAIGNVCGGVGGQLSNGGACIYGAGLTGFSISGNVSDGAFGNGFDIVSSAQGAITGNVARAGQAGGFVLAGDTDVTLSGNVGENNGQYSANAFRACIALGLQTGGLNMARVTLNNNICNDSQGSPTQLYGLQVNGTASTLSGLWVDYSNDFTANGTGAFGGTNGATAPAYSTSR